MAPVDALLFPNAEQRCLRSAHLLHGKEPFGCQAVHRAVSHEAHVCPGEVRGLKATLNIHHQGRECFNSSSCCMASKHFAEWHSGGLAEDEQQAAPSVAPITT